MSKLPRIIFTDIDGVWTDGGMYYDQLGNEWKKFNTADSAGVLFARTLGIPVGIVTGENTEIVARRAAKLKIDHVFQDVRNKLELVSRFCSENNIDLAETAYIGDDVNDIPLLKVTGFSASPANAPSYVKQHSQFITKTRGGDGAFREFVEEILRQHGVLEKAIAEVVAHHEKPV